MTARRRRQLLTEDSSCEGKKRYDGKHHAERAARQLRREGENVHVYACKYCGHYHVGHSDRVMER